MTTPDAAEQAAQKIVDDHEAKYGALSGCTVLPYKIAAAIRSAVEAEREQSASWRRVAERLQEELTDERSRGKALAEAIETMDNWYPDTEKLRDALAAYGGTT